MQRTPGKYAVQFITDVPDGLDFTARTVDSFDDAFAVCREVVATHPDFKWDGVLIWRDMTAEDVRAATAEAEEAAKRAGE